MVNASEMRPLKRPNPVAIEIACPWVIGRRNTGPGFSIDSLRECRPPLWNGTGDPPGHDLRHPEALVPVPDGTIGCGQDHAAAPAVHVAATDPRPDSHVRTRPLADSPHRVADAAPAGRH